MPMSPIMTRSCSMASVFPGCGAAAKGRTATPSTRKPLAASFALASLMRCCHPSSNGWKASLTHTRLQMPSS